MLNYIGRQVESKVLQKHLQVTAYLRQLADIFHAFAFTSLASNISTTQKFAFVRYSHNANCKTWYVVVVGCI